MKCPKCKEQTLKEDYADKRPNSDKLYCPECGFSKSRAKLERDIRRENKKYAEHLAKMKEDWIERSKETSLV